MPSNPTDPTPTPPQAGGLLARLRGMVHGMKPAEPDHKKPESDGPQGEPETLAAETADGPPDNVSLATPVAQDAEKPASPTEPESSADGAPEAGDPVPLAEPVATVAKAEPAPPPTAPSPVRVCALCQAPRKDGQSYCDDCGWVFPADSEPAPAEDPVANPADASARVRDRYELTDLLAERDGVSRFRGLDHGAGTAAPAPVVVLRAPLPAPAEPVPVVEAAPPAEPAEEDEEILPGFEDVPSGASDTGVAPPMALPFAVTEPVWPGLAWERCLLENAQHPGLPRALDAFAEGGYEYLVEEVPPGRTLWDAWDDPESTAEQRFGWLKDVAEMLQRLHQLGALVEVIRPDVITVTPGGGRAMLADLADLLPLPLPPNPPIRATHYTAPELVFSPEQADARADLYGFGAMVYALYLGRELTERDFERQGVPKPFVAFFPDAHPLFARVLLKTFCREPADRFPTDEAATDDPTGFAELIRTLDVCRRTIGNVRLEVAAWTTTGMIRSGNEDAFALLHAVESHQDDLGEQALVLLADGMGGYEAGEVAAALAIQSLRRFLLAHRLFGALAGGPPPGAGDFSVEACKQQLRDALKDANKQVFQASRGGAAGRRGMGCTAEAVYLDGRHVVVGHVGDSRTYHLHEGRLIQLTRDQTLVNRLLELGQLTPEEAENHPRRSELQQAVGGRPDVEPDLYYGRLSPGDWVVVCSDGVSNHVKPEELQEMLQSEAASAEMAARRLVNLVNLRGATDNATIIVVRCT
jgi:serine/threonine protein phosphatase PrpC